ncbi:MAG TPA: branched-chain amino acid ABC transporter permease [Streptosporangiaceae bacterium]
MTLLRHLAAAVVAGLVLVLLTIQLDGFRQYQMAEIACYVIAVAGLTALVGLSGQISLGHGAFMAIGAYSAALLLLHLHWPLAAVLVASTLITAASGAVVGVAAARLRGPYLAGATLLLAVALPSLALSDNSLFGGDQGLTVVANTPAFLGPSFPLTRWQAWLTCFCALITLVLLANLGRSRVGRSWRAAGDDEVAAALAGLNVARLRVLAFVVSAACAGLAGVLLALTTSIVSPGAYSLTLSIALLTGAVLGGLGSLAGTVWGSLVLVLVPTYVQDVATSHGLSSSAGSNIPVVAYGVVLVVVMLLFPDGIQGGLVRLYRLAAARVPALPWRGRARPDSSARPAAPAPQPRASASEHQEEGSI